MRIGDLQVQGDLTGQTKDGIIDNIALNAFRIAINGSLSVQNMIDGIVDEFEDETGVDTGTSQDERYVSADDYYDTQPTPTEVDYMEYATDGAAQAAYVTDASMTYGSDLVTGGETYDSDSNYGADNADRAADGNTSTHWTSGDSSSTHWWEIDFGGGNSEKINKYYIDFYNYLTDNDVESITLKGSDTGSFSGEETTIDTWDTSSEAPFDNDNISREFSNDTSYRYYRLYFSMDGNIRISIYEIEMYEGTQNLQSFSEASIKNQGSYSLKGVADTSADGKKLVKTFSTPIDVSSQNDLYYDIRSNRTGANLQMNLLSAASSNTKLIAPLDDLYDYSIHAHTLNLVGSSFLDSSTKKFGTKSIYVDGTSNYAYYADSDDWNFDSGLYTVEFWVKRDGSQNDTSTIMCQWNNANGSAWYLVWRSSHYLAFTCRASETGGYSNVLSTQAFDDGWHHISINGSGGTNKVYVDGNLEITYTNGIYDSSLNLEIGGSWNGFTGWVDDLIILKGARLRTANFTAPSVPHDKERLFEAITVNSADTWETKTIDIEDLDSIKVLEIEVIDDTSANTFYLDNVYGASLPAGLTLQSNGFTADSEADDARMVMFIEASGITLNTDLKAYVSRDGGTTFSQITLEDMGDYETGKSVVAGNVDISGQPSGTSMKYKITTHNSKDIKIHGTGLLWS